MFTFIYQELSIVGYIPLELDMWKLSLHPFILLLFYFLRSEMISIKMKSAVFWNSWRNNV